MTTNNKNLQDSITTGMAAGLLGLVIFGSQAWLPPTVHFLKDVLENVFAPEDTPIKDSQVTDDSDGHCNVSANIGDNNTNVNIEGGCDPTIINNYNYNWDFDRNRNEQLYALDTTVSAEVSQYNNNNDESTSLAVKNDTWVEAQADIDVWANVAQPSVNQGPVSVNGGTLSISTDNKNQAFETVPLETGGLGINTSTSQPQDAVIATLLPADRTKAKPDKTVPLSQSPIQTLPVTSSPPATDDHKLPLDKEPPTFTFPSDPAALVPALVPLDTSQQGGHADGSDAESIPEPSLLIGLTAAVGGVAVTRRKEKLS